MDAPALEAVGWFLTRVEADIACSAIQAAGIPAVVSADDAAGTRPHLWMGGVRVLVPAENADEAREIVREAENPPPPAPE